MRIQCEICKEWIAEADEITFPLRGDMFKSPDPFHGIEAPFHPDSEWEHMRCPYGAHRPFVSPDRVTTDQGIIEAPEEVPVYRCKVCGKEYNNPNQLRGHESHHKRHDEWIA